MAPQYGSSHDSPLILWLEWTWDRMEGTTIHTQGWQSLPILTAWKPYKLRILFKHIRRALAYLGMADPAWSTVEHRVDHVILSRHFHRRYWNKSQLLNWQFQNFSPLCEERKFQNLVFSWDAAGCETCWHPCLTFIKPILERDGSPKALPRSDFTFFSPGKQWHSEKGSGTWQMGFS